MKTLNHATARVYASELAPSSVNLTVYYWVGSQQANVLRVNDQVVTGIKLALDKAEIDMPFPHAVVLLENQPDGPTVLSRPPAKAKAGVNANVNGLAI